MKVKNRRLYVQSAEFIALRKKELNIIAREIKKRLSGGAFHVLYLEGKLIMKEKDKEIEYLEERIKELEKTVQKLAKDKKQEIFGNRPPRRFFFGDMPEGKPVCSLCGTVHNVELKDGLDVYLCINCVNNWN